MDMDAMGELQFDRFPFKTDFDRIIYSAATRTRVDYRIVF